MKNLDYAWYHLDCVVSIIGGQPEALGRMDISADGFWRSFAAIPLALPALFFSWVISARQTQSETPIVSIGALVAAEAGLELLLWLLPVIVLAFVLGPLGFGPRFTHLIIVRNWTALLMTYLVALATSPYVVAGPANGLMLLVTLLVLVAVVFVAVRTTRTALDSTPTMAFGLVIAELMIGLVVAAAFYGLLVPSSA